MSTVLIPQVYMIRPGNEQQDKAEENKFERKADQPAKLDHDSTPRKLPFYALPVLRKSIRKLPNITPAARPTW